MAHRLRYATSQDPFAAQLTGTVEVDETYVGGRRRKKVPRTVKPGERPHDQPSATDNKQAVVSMVERNGDVRSHHVQRVNAATLRPILNHHIEYGARL